MTTKIIRSIAPTRIDLAGGTLDIWPLYLFLKKSITINAAIDLFAEATLESSPLKSEHEEAFVTIISEDQHQELHLPWTFYLQSEEKIPEKLELPFRLIRHFLTQKISENPQLKRSHLKLMTRAKSPAGAGLGGSSTLSIAIIGALSTWEQETPPQNDLDLSSLGERFITIAKDIESTVIRVPAGLQDYYGAMYGGLQILRWKVGNNERSPLPFHLLEELQDRILLFYSGQSRNSGINNWVLFKDFLDQKGDVRTHFEKINLATHHLESALRREEWNHVGKAIDEEWQTRRALADQITTPEIDRAFKKASSFNKISGKICGAGGGGCFFVYLPVDSESERTQLKVKIQEAFTEQGIQHLPFHFSPKGLQISVKHL